jgi:hypothetical protein
VRTTISSPILLASAAAEAVLVFLALMGILIQVDCVCFVFLYTIYMDYRASIFCTWILCNYIYLLLTSIYNTATCLHQVKVI